MALCWLYFHVDLVTGASVSILQDTAFHRRALQVTISWAVRLKGMQHKHDFFSKISAAIRNVRKKKQS